MILSTHHLSAHLGKTAVLHDLSFSIEEGETVAVLGRNGAGKSTLLRCLNRQLPPSAGEIRLQNHPLPSIPREDLAREMAYLPQRIPHPPMTVFDAVLLGRLPHMAWRASPHDYAKVEEAIHLLHLEEIALQSLDRISGGEAQRVALARVLAQEPRLLLLDEPTNNLDLGNQIELLSLLQKAPLKDRPSTVAVLHDINLALRFAHRALFLKEGRLHSFVEIAAVDEEIIREVFDMEAVMGEIHGYPLIVPI